MKLEYAPFALLVSLIRGAKAVLFPSLYEGFGLPVLESMMLGTPVLTSKHELDPRDRGRCGVDGGSVRSAGDFGGISRAR